MEYQKLNEFYFIIFSVVICTSFHLKYKMAFWLPFSATIYYFSCIYSFQKKKLMSQLGTQPRSYIKKNQFFIYTHAILNYDVLKNRLKKNKICFVVFFEFNKKKKVILLRSSFSSIKYNAFYIFFRKKYI